MRAIKFRAWDESLGRMVFCPTLEYRKDGTVFSNNFDSYGKLVERPLMQFTGLHDANGVEIYEGDLIAPRHYPFYGDGPEIEGGGACKDLNYVGEIFWSEDDLGWAVGLHVVSDRVVGRSCGGALYDYCDIETIGNIHENPELVSE